MFKSISAVSKFVIGELFYTYCYFCKERTDALILCEKCNSFSKVLPPLCLRCGESLPSEMQECLTCLSLKRKRFLDSVRSHYWLEERSKKLIHLAKYHHDPMYLDAFKFSFRGFESPLPIETVIIPVPISFEKFLERSYNQTWVIGSWISRATGRPFLSDGLLKSHETGSQTKLTKIERQKNLRKSFHWAKTYRPPKSILLVDDVMTTGATLEECARTLKKAGVAHVSAWTLFRTPLSYSMEKR